MGLFSVTPLVVYPPLSVSEGLVRRSIEARVVRPPMFFRIMKKNPDKFGVFGFEEAGRLLLL